MIVCIRLLRNIGQFDSVSAGATIPLARLTLVYSENGMGKTTLAAVLRSLGTGDPVPIADRRRLAAQHSLMSSSNAAEGRQRRSSRTTRGIAHCHVFWCSTTCSSTRAYIPA